MTDKEFLSWIYDRMTYKHGENKNVDYMLKFRSIIDSLQEEPVSDDLEKAAEESARIWRGEKWMDGGHIKGFKAGAQWQKEKLVTWLTRESDFLIQELKKGNKAYGLPEQYRAQLYKEIVNKLKEE